MSDASAAFEHRRPDPDQLLSDYKAEEAKAVRGKLRIFFGSSAGVGKTYAMLLAAQVKREQGWDVLVGVLETHGRSETAALLDGLECLPLRDLFIQRAKVREFDLDAALRRRPALILVDELAHANAAGSRHPKRWQDIDELQSVGIDVWTTLNVQHLESLNDVVGSITGIRVWETVPDTFFDGADDIVLVDVPADELLARLNAGKVYLPEHAERASHNFFRKGNLMALRELALRRTADRVEGDVQAYRAKKVVDSVWKTEAALLCCVGPDPGGEHLVRSAARLAMQLAVGWTCVYVETPALQRLDARKRERILLAIKLAQELGAKTAVLAANDVALALVDYARAHNCSKVILGRTHRRPRWPWDVALQQQIARLAPDADLLDVGTGTQGSVASPTATHRVVDRADVDPRRDIKRVRYAWTLLACALTGAVAAVIFPYFDLANIVMLFLLTVVLVAMRAGRGPAVLAAFVSVAIFDFFFVPPRFSFAVSDAQYLLTFAVMLTVALIIGQLTAGLRYQAQVAAHREQRARTLYEFARDLSSMLQTSQVVQTSVDVIARTFSASAALFVVDQREQLLLASTSEAAPPANRAAAEWAFQHSQAAGAGTNTLAGDAFVYLPLRAPMRTRGVLAIQPRDTRLLLVPEQRRHLDTFAALVAIALERVHYVDVAQDALVRMESQRIRSYLLSTLSHDLTSPLGALRGLAESLSASTPPLSPQQLQSTQALLEEIGRMSSLLDDLIDTGHEATGDR